ncbi:MAG: DUF2281 domain-containing protein [Pseudomonadota bacterium]
MTLAEDIYQHSLRLPESAAREALDFIDFLEQRYAKADHDDPQSVVITPKQQDALAHIASVRIHWGGKPIPDRNALYDASRG